MQLENDLKNYRWKTRNGQENSMKILEPTRTFQIKIKRQCLNSHHNDWDRIFNANETKQLKKRYKVIPQLAPVSESEVRLRKRNPE